MSETTAAPAPATAPEATAATPDAPTAGLSPDGAPTIDLDATAADADTPEPEAAGEEFDADRALTKIRKANAEAKALREAKKAAEERASVAEAKAGQAETLQADVQSLTAQLNREKVARRLGLEDTEANGKFLARLQGTTVDELLADAEDLLSLTTARKPTGPASTRPVESLRGGGTTPTEAAPTDLDTIAAGMFRR